MMLNRDKISFWVRLVAIALAVIFVGSFIFMGIGTNINYNLFDLLSGGSEQQQQEQAQTTGSEEQLARAEQELEENPEDPKTIRRLAGLYLENGQTDRATEVLKEGRGVVPEDPVIPVYLGQAYERKAQGLTDEDERQATYEQAGDAYATAAELQEDRPQVYLLAGQAYEQAGEKSKAIKYWNDYLELEPEGEQAEAVKERIDSLLKGEDTSDGTKGTPKQ